MNTAESSELERLLGDLVAADSSNPPGREEEVAGVVAAAARRFGLPEPRRHALDPVRPNLLYELGSGSPTLLLGAHLDTVPAEAALWKSDPLRLALDGDRYRGLGVADMKGAAAAMLVAAATLGLTPGAGRVILAFTADEEGTGGYGMSWLCSNGLIEADAAVLLEPASVSQQSWDNLYVAERGSCVLDIVAHGEAGHSGHPLPSAERASTPFTAALAALAEADLFSQLRHPLDATPPLVNLPTMVSGGVTPWQYPATFEATAEIRTIPGMTPNQVLSDVRAVVAARGLCGRVKATVRSWAEPLPAVSDERLLHACRSALSTATGADRTSAVFPATTDASYLAASGIPTIPALGPGSLAAIHQPNESVLRADLKKTVRLLRDLVSAYLLR